MNNCLKYLDLGDMHDTSKLKKLALGVEKADSIIKQMSLRIYSRRSPSLHLKSRKLWTRKWKLSHVGWKEMILSEVIFLFLLILKFSSRDSLTKSVQLSPKPATLSQSQPTNNSIIKRHPVVTNRRVVTQPQPKLPQAAAPVQQQQGQKSMVTGQAAQAQPLRVGASGGARPGQTTTRTVIIGAQLQNMVALGQKIVMRGPGCMEGWSLVNPMWEIWVNLGLWPTGCTRYEDSDERPRVYGGMKPSQLNVRDLGKPGTVTNQIWADFKQIFWPSQIEKQRALSAFQEGNLNEAAGGVSLPTNPILASDLDLSPPLTIKSPSRARIMLHVSEV